MFRRLLLVFTDKELRNKLLSVIGLLIIARLLAHVPIPVLRSQDISPLIESDAVFSLLNTISGGAYGKLSFVMLGVGPFITATIVMQLLGVIVPKINEIQKEEGEQGRNKINRWTRIITVPLAAINAWGILQFLSSGQAGGVNISLPPELTSTSIAETFPYWTLVILSMVAGSIIMMWIGEIMTEIKMGNGISLLILSGIVVRLPSQIGKFFTDALPNIQALFGKVINNPSNLISWEAWKQFLWESPDWAFSRIFFLYLTIFLLTLIFVVYINDAVRKLIVIYSRRGHTEGKSRTLSSITADLPVKVNMAGVLPIIFAVSFILFPSIVSRFFLTSNTSFLRETAKNIESYLSAQDQQNYTFANFDKLPRQNYLGFAFTQSKEEVEALKSYNPTIGQELFGFTLSTQSDVENSFFEGTPLNDIKIPWTDNYLLRFNGTNFGFLPQFSVRWNGVLAYTFYYFLLIIFFTYFYTSVIAFKTDEVAENLQKSGAYIPGYRPGLETQEYLSYVSNRLNVAGSVFLAVIAVMPFIFNRYLQIGDGTLTGIVGGTTLLILVSVTIETLKQIEAQATIVDYDRFIN
jgi:preprotein translocase subunit SecY